MKFSAEASLLLAVCRQYCLDAPEDLPPLTRKIDSGRLLELAERHELMPQVYAAFKPQICALGDEAAGRLQNTYYVNLLRSQQACAEFERLAASACRQGIQLVPLKGVAFLSSIWRRLPVRMMTDIDLLVRSRDRDAVERMLTAHGYSKQLYGLSEDYWRNRHYHLSFHKQSPGQTFVLEMHWALDYPGRQAVCERSFWDRLISVKAVTGQRWMLTPEDSLLALLLHLGHFGNILGLKHVLDAALLMRSSASFDWEYVCLQAGGCGLTNRLYFLLAQVSLFGADLVPQRVRQRLRVAFLRRAAIDRFVRGATFGRIGPKNAFFVGFVLTGKSWSRALSEIVHIPLEQFAKFYDLDPYSPRTRRLYVLRAIYPLLRPFCGKGSARR